MPVIGAFTLLLINFNRVICLLPPSNQIMRFRSLKPNSLREIISCFTELRGISSRRDEAIVEWCQLRQSEREVGIFEVGGKPFPVQFSGKY